MDENFNAGTVGITTATTYDLGLRAHMQRVFSYMGGGLALTGIVAWIVANTELAGMIYGTPLKWLAMLAPFAFVMVLQFKMQTLSANAIRGLFWSYCGTMGLSLGMIFLIYTNASIARAFFVTAGTFGAMSLWGYTTKRDLTGFGSFLLMGLIGLVIASVVNIFMVSNMLSWVTSVIGVFIFTGLTAYQTQQIKETYSANWGREANDKLAVFGALQLYMNFINVFLSLLRLFGDRR